MIKQDQAFYYVDNRTLVQYFIYANILIIKALLKTVWNGCFVGMFNNLSSVLLFSES